jgi:Secretion system C-terminal sorting domain
MNYIKNLLLLATLLIQLSTYSQNEYFANNPIWGMSYPCQFAPFEPEWGKKVTHFIAGDTLLNDEVFVKIYEEGFTYYGTGTSSYTETPYSNPLPLALLRSEELKMYVWSAALNMKVLLYDFDVTVGEPFDISSSISNPLVVESITYITLGGLERKVITTVGENSSWEHIYIEGVGHWRGLWNQNEQQLDCQTYLTCYSLNGESYFVNTDETPWLVPSTETCEFVVSIKEIAHDEISVYPNPARNELTIEVKSPISSLKVSDITGRIVLASHPNTTQINLNIEPLPTGCYFLSVTTESGSIETLKFLKD